MCVSIFNLTSALKQKLRTGTVSKKEQLYTAKNMTSDHDTRGGDHDDEIITATLND